MAEKKKYNTVTIGRDVKTGRFISVRNAKRRRNNSGIIETYSRRTPLK